MATLLAWSARHLNPLAHLLCENENDQCTDKSNGVEADFSMFRQLIRYEPVL